MSLPLPQGCCWLALYTTTQKAQVRGNDCDLWWAGRRKHSHAQPPLQHLSTSHVYIALNLGTPAHTGANATPVRSKHDPFTAPHTCMLHQLLPLRVRCAWQCAMPVQRARASEQARESTFPQKNKCDKQVSSWRHISCHTDKNRYYT